MGSVQNKNIIISKLALLLALSGLTTTMTACLETQKATEVGTTDSSQQEAGAGAGGNNSDFSVVTDPDTAAAGGDTTVGNGDSTFPIEGNAGVIDPETYLGFTINQGASMTAGATLHLEHYPPFFTWQTKISYGDACSGGTWENYNPVMDFTSTQVNQLLTLSAQYRDRDGRVSDCYTQKIVIDQAGPDIIFKQYPTTAVQAGSDVVLIVDVSDEFSQVAEATCKFQNIAKACGGGLNTITIPSIAEGNYTFSVTAKDSGGFSSSKSITFSVTSLYKNMSQKVQVKDSRMVDILFIIDNSKSMQYEQKNMAARMSKFLEVLRGLDYQIAITTTDPKNSTYGDGRLVAMKGLSNKYMITSAMNEDTAQKVLGDTLQRSEIGDSKEQAIYATTRMVERAKADPASIYGKFFRTDAQFAAVVISDEDESGDTKKNDPQNLLKLLQTNFNGNKSFSFHSVITRPGDKACHDGEGATYGNAYDAFSKLTGGVIGSVCAANYSNQVRGIAEGVRNTLKTLTLSCKPVVNGFYNIEVLKDGVVYNGTRALNGVNLAFDDVLPTGKYEVLYTCLK